MALPKWNDERTAQLVNLVGDNTPVTQETLVEVAEAMETTKRSISSKLRKMGYDVEFASASNASKFSDEQEAALRSVVENNPGQFTYGELAAQFEDFSAKQIQGKILSMELTGNIKPTPKPETVRKYSESEEEAFVKLALEGACLEEIAEAMDRPIASVRGKALSFLRTGVLESIPKQRDVKSKDVVDAFASLENVNELTVEEIATEIGKTPRGVRTMLTRRGVTCKDYDGAARKAKASE